MGEWVNGGGRKVPSSEFRVPSVKWKVESGKWKVESEEWGIEKCWVMNFELWMEERMKVLIVGAGIIGMSLAYEWIELNPNDEKYWNIRNLRYL